MFPHARRRARTVAAIAPLIVALARPAAADDAGEERLDERLDEVRLRDGSRLRGRVLREEPGEWVVIETDDRRRHTLRWAAVDEVSLAPAPQAAPAPRPPFLSWEARAHATAIVVPSRRWDVTGWCATGSGTLPVSTYGQSDEGRGFGAGGGVGARVAWTFLAPPARPGGAWWWGVRAGGGVDLDELYGRVPAGISPVEGALCAQVQSQPRAVEYRSTSIFLAQVPFQIGAHLGMGRAVERAGWRGVVLGAAWAPSYVHLAPAAGDATSTFAWLGAELTLDLATRAGGGAAEAPQPHVRFALFVAPSRNDQDPTIVKLAIGAVWY